MILLNNLILKQQVFKNFFYFIIIYVFFFKKISADAAHSWQLGFQDPATPVMEGIIYFNNQLMFVMILIACFVGWMLYRSLYLFSEEKKDIFIPENFTHSTLLEIVWTISPALILMLIGLPSFALLYSMDEIIDPSITLKVIGHQWYWSYEYSDYINHTSEILSKKITEIKSINFDSYMIPEEELNIPKPYTTGKAGKVFRLLEVDNRVILPINTHIRVLITSSDVLHSWAIPSLGVKVDSCPGRLNQVNLFVKRLGVFYGQCSEICGVNHGFMPIVIESVNLEKYVTWIGKRLEI
uniref:cytochrome oxidase subunit II n=1 Tax=Dictyotopsis propagulifera TaxID=670095 RepID=UPI002E76E3A2|nr:cytochrome oxidase subunit II [Dictyotopsis propagulifera]WBP69965.1 cytochrome oxidase subunit II [Dictyotopsis propagulifera]